MKRSSVAYTAVFLIVLIVLFLLLRIWSSSRAYGVIGPAAIHRGPDGNVYIMSNDTLYIHDKDGGLVDRIPMNRFGIDRVIGDFWPLGSGDLLLRREVPQTLTIAGEAEHFARTGAGERDRLGNGESILQRCGIATFQCSNFGSGKDVFDKITAFSLMPDEEKGITYLSDTVGHQLLILDNKGNVTGRSKTPFLFPNHIVLDNGLLYVSDTNNHRIAVVRTEKENYGELVKAFPIVDPRSALIPTWPMSVAHGPDDKWWVINAGDNMSFGMVMILNEKGAFEKVVRLPKGADPLRLAVLGDRVLITDPTLMRVYSADKNGRLGEDFGSLLFQLDLSELRRERKIYDLLSTLSLWSLLWFLGGALLLAREARLQAAAEPAMPTMTHPAVLAPRPRDPGTERYDFHSVIGIYRIKFAVITVLLLVAFAFYYLISRGLTVYHAGFFPATLLGHSAISFFTYLQLKRTYVEINERGITCQGMIRNISAPWNTVRKITVYGSMSTVVTDQGNFTIGAVEPADHPPRGWFDLYRRNRLKLHKELIEKIQQRAPQAKVNISWLVRYQWKRL